MNIIKTKAENWSDDTVKAEVFTIIKHGKHGWQQKFKMNGYDFRIIVKIIPDPYEKKWTLYSGTVYLVEEGTQKNVTQKNVICHVAKFEDEKQWEGYDDNLSVERWGDSSVVVAMKIIANIL